MGEGEEPVHPERLPSQHPALARSSGPLTRYPSTCPCVTFGSTPLSSPTDTIRTKRNLPFRGFPGASRSRYGTSPGSVGGPLAVHGHALRTANLLPRDGAAEADDA